LVRAPGGAAPIGSRTSTDHFEKQVRRVRGAGSITFVSGVTTKRIWREQLEKLMRLVRAATSIGFGSGSDHLEEQLRPIQEATQTITRSWSDWF
jgi:hypothetical protein